MVHEALSVEYKKETKYKTTTKVQREMYPLPLVWGRRKLIGG